MNLVERVKKAGKRYIPYLLAGTLGATSVNGCGISNPFGPKKNKAPETVIERVSTNLNENSKGNVYFFIYGDDKEDGVTDKCQFRIVNSENYSEWTTTNLQDNFIHLPVGQYNLEARAIDSKGKLDATPAVKTFEVFPTPEEPTLPTQPELITQPVEILSNNTRVFEGTTNQDGLVSFIDETAEDGQATVFITDIETQQSAPSMQVIYEDLPDSKVFTAIDPSRALLPTRRISPHNSDQPLITASVRRGKVHAQTIEDEEGFRAFYLWESNPALAANPYTRFTYETTIDESERIKKDKANQVILTVLKPALSKVGLFGEKITNAIETVEIFGINLNIPLNLADFAEELNPYGDKELEGIKRWDVYRTSQGTSFSPEILQDVLIVPSNIPEISFIASSIHNNSNNLTWQAYDATEYAMPFELPGIQDLTVLLGPTPEPDLTYNYRLAKDSQTVREDSIAQASLTLEDLAAGDYEFELSVRDEVNNVSSDTLSFSIGERKYTSPIVFLSDREDVLKKREIFIMEGDGSNVRKLLEATNISQYAYPCISPDGTRIIFRKRVNLLYLFNIIDKTELNFLGYGMSSSWSPDGTRAVYGGKINDIRDIYINNNVEHSNAINITNNDCCFLQDIQPSWSPDGQRIAFASNRDTNQLNKYDIYTMNIDGTEVKRLTFGNGNYTNIEPAWDPRGTQIAFETDQNGFNEIYRMDYDGSNQANLTKNPSQNQHPSWSPDGQRIAFASNRDGYYQIFTVNRDGTNTRKITNTSSNNISPSWSPF
ncbi:MAG: hypothetical protein KKG75_04210 [Nanoarchaeota archaeon]|nr:hypothetical protein [Nanoarchaeota archaeon]